MFSHTQHFQFRASLVLLRGLFVKAIQILFVPVFLISQLGLNTGVATAAPSTNALQFAGATTSYVTFGQATTTLGTATFTLELWFKRTGTGVATSTGTGGLTSAIPLLTKGRGEADGSNLDCNYFLGIRSTDNVLAADFEDNATGLNHPIVGVTPIVNNVWYHGAATYNGTKWQLFLNGKLEAELTVGKTPRYDSIQHAGIGTALNSTGGAAGGFAGVIDEARVWNYARTQAEILSTMNVEVTSPYPSTLLGYWQMNEGSGTTVTDATGHINGTAVGATWAGVGAGFPINVDTTAPATVSGLAAAAGDRFSTLTWTANGEPDLVGYNVYRSTTLPVPTTTPINGANLVAANTYVDGGLTNGATYYYVVTAVDSSGNASVAPTEVSATPAAATGYALQFNGSTNYVTFGNASKLGVETFTIEAWFKRVGAGVTVSTGGVTAEPLVTKGGADPIVNYFLGIQPSNGFLVADFDGVDPAGTNQPIIGTSSVADGTWHHGAVTYDGVTERLYVDGVQQNSIGRTKVAPPSTGTAIAALATTLNSSGVASGYFNGILDEVRIWNYARSAADINANKSVEILAAPGLLGRWGLNEGTGTQINDTSGRGINGTAMNSPVWATDTPFGAPPTPPAAPTGLAVTAPTFGQVHLAWTDNASNETGFEVQRSTSGIGGPFSLLTTVGVNSQTYDDLNRAGGQEYCYQVRAVNGAGQSSYAGPLCVTTPAEGASGLRFDGANDYVTFGSAPALGVQTFTIETWFNWTGGGSTANTGSGGVDAIPLVTKGLHESDGGTQDANYFLGITLAGKLAADFEEYGGGQNYPVTGSSTVTTNTWHHAAVTYDGQTWNLYLDGQLDTTLKEPAPHTPRYDSIQHAGIATAMNTTGVNEGYFAGDMDEVRIWNVARTQAQIMSTINSELTSGAGLIARWGMNEGSGAYLNNSVGAVAGTLVHTPTWVAGAPFNIVAPTIPLAPTLLNATPTAGLAIDLAWVDNSSNETSFKIERAPTDTGAWTQIWTTAANAVTYSDTGLTAATQYCYRVRASNSAGDSDYSNVSCADTPGAPNNGLDFGTANAYVDLGNPATLGLKTFTLETWFRRTAAGATTYTGNGGVVAVPLISKGMAEGESIALDVNYFLGIGNIVGNSTNVLVADFEECTQGQPGCQSGGTSSLNHPVIGVTPIAADGVWHHAAVTYDGRVWKLYLDGNLENTLDLGATIYPQFASSQKLAFGTAFNSSGLPGASSPYGPGYFVGNLDEVRMWDVARTQAEIQGTLNSAITSPQPNLVGRWALDETSGSTVPSSAGTAVPGTIMGTGSSWGPGAPGIVNHTPAFVLASPADGASGISTSPTLSVHVTDADLDNQTVSFYGRLKNSVGPDFSLIAIPDTQYYAASYPSIYNAQMQWVIDNKTALNIPYVVSLGDNVDNSNVTSQWNVATTAWDMLTTAGIPYGLAAGNHDGAPSSTANFNTNFGTRKTGQTGTYGGRYGTSDYDNYYTYFDAGGLHFIVLFIELDDSMTSTSNPVLVWANDVLSTNSSRRAIVVTHNLLLGGTSSAFSPQGQAIYDALKGNPNLFLMLGGHLDVARQRSDTWNGHTVYSLRSDYQFVDSSQSGYLRIMHFSPASNSIHVSTYSPTRHQGYPDETPPQNDFVLPYDMGGSPVFSLINTENNVPAGTDASVVWPGLANNTQYEWYATSSDGQVLATSATRSFTTAPASVTCYALTLSHTGQGNDPSASPANSTGCPAGQYAAGEPISLSGAAASTGWQISGWTGTGNDASTASTNSLTMPASAQAAGVNYSQIVYTLTTTSTNGTVNRDNPGPYHYSDVVQLTAVPDNGYVFASWSGDAVGTTNPVSVTMDGNKSVTASFNSLPVHNVTLNTYYGTIQAAVNAALPGNTIQIAAGTYVENVMIPTSLILAGASQATTIIKPAQSNPDCGNITNGDPFCTNASTVILVNADNVTIHDLTIDGNNPALTSGVVLGGADVDARSGILSNYPAGPFNSLTVHHVTVQNVYLRGIQTRGTFDFHDDTVTNVQASYYSIAMFGWYGPGIMRNNYVSYAQDAISANHSKGIQFLDNTVTESGSGVHTDNAADGGGVADVIHGNTVANCNTAWGGYGIFVFMPYVAPAVDGNTITNCKFGLSDWGQGAAVAPTFTGNTVNGSGLPGSIGVRVSTDLTDIYAAVFTDVSVGFTGNSITGNATGVLLTGDAAHTLNAAFSNNQIYGNTKGLDQGITGTYNASATPNWWGDASGPGEAGPGTGNTIVAGVPYAPWCTDAACTRVVATLVSPSGTVPGGWDGTFSWTGVTGASMYYVQILQANDTNVWTQWYTAADACTGLDCHVTLSSLSSLPAGNYKWHVLDWGSYGYGAWTEFTNFDTNPACYALTTSVLPVGSGMINVTAPNCGSNYRAGTVVQLSAVPNSGYLFDHWSGGASGTANPVSITLDGDKSVTANLRETSATLGSPSGMVPAGWDGTFQWSGVTGASMYYVQILQANDTNVWTQWYMAADNCTGLTCHVTLSSLRGLPSGDYKWRVLDWGSYGYGAWTGFTNFNSQPVHNVTQDTYYGTIQAAVNAASAGDTLSVAAGTYTETGQMVISKNLTIVGADKTTTIIKPGSDTTGAGDAGSWILVNDGVTLNLSRVTLDGVGRQIRQGIRFNGSGVVDDVIVQNMVSPGYSGFGIAQGYDNTGARTLVVTNSTFSNYGRVGIQADNGTGSSTVTISGSTFSGKGDGDHLDYGVTVEGGAHATITGNTFSNNRGVASLDGSTSGGVEASTYFASGTEVTITGNTFINNTYGLNIGYYSTDTSAVTAHDNLFINNSVAGIATSSTTTTVNASSNWWGDASGPGVVGPGAGDKVSANVSYRPWCTNPTCTAFAPVVLGSPAGTVPAGWDGTFQWSGVTGASMYYVQILQANDTNVWTQWYTAADACTGLACHVTLSSLSSLPSGGYKWRVLDWGSYGYGAWTGFMNFDTNPACYALTTSVLPAGSGVVNATAPNCGAGYAAGTVVQLSAVPNSEYLFNDWSGGASGTANPVSITMDADKSVTANLREISATLLSPKGTVPAGWDGTFQWSGVTGASMYYVQILQANDANVWTQWYTAADTCTGLDCHVTLSSLSSLPSGGYKWRVLDWGGYGYGAWTDFTSFDTNPACYVLTTSVLPVGSGVVNATAPNCGANYRAGTVVQLSAVPNSGYVFNDWSGGASGTANPVSITMDADKSVTANLREASATLLSPSLTVPAGWDGTFQWSGVTGASMYYVQILQANDANVWTQWYTAADACTGLDCHVTLSSLSSLPSGGYKWRVLDWGGYGYGAWTDFTEFQVP